MAKLLIYSAILACAILAMQWVKLLLLRRKQRRQIQLHGCQPPKTLAQNPLYFGFDVVREMVGSYNAGSRNAQLAEKFKTHGSTFRAEGLGVGRIYTIDSANLRTVFGDRSDHWGVVPVRYEAFRPLVSSGVLITDGNEWGHARRIAQGIIDRIYKRYSSDLSTFEEAAQALVNRIPCDGTTVDLQPLFYQYTVDSSTDNIFGKRIGALQPGPEGDYGREFLDAFVFCLKCAGERDEVPQWSHAIVDSKFRAAASIVHTFVDKNIHLALGLCSEKETSNDFAAKWAMNNTNLLEARNQILNVVAASFDTIAILLTNTFFHLARNPDCYAKLRTEVLSFDETLDSNSIKTLRYLHFVLNESLRLNGPASFNSRVALVDGTLPAGGGKDGSHPIFVPKGDIVIVSAYALQRQEDIYGADPECFRPERWETIKPKHWDFIPFSGGPRVCPGQKFALLHAAYALLYLTRQFQVIENRDPEKDLIEEYRVATGSKNGAKVALWK